MKSRKDQRPDDPGKESGVSVPRRVWVFAWKLAAAALVLLGTLAVAVLVGLSLPAAQQLLLSKISSHLERSLGIRLEADSLQVRLLRGEAQGKRISLSVAEPAAEPFLVVDDLEVRLRWASLWDGPIELTRVQLRGAQVALDAPLPTGTQDRQEPEPYGGIPVEIPLLQASGVELSGPVPADGATWLKDWLVTNLVLTGKVKNGALALELESQVVVETDFPDQVKQESWAGDLQAEVGLEADGAFRLSRLKLSGHGVEVKGAASGGLHGPLQLEAEVGARIDPSRWWRRAEEAKELHAEVSLSLLEGLLSVELTANTESIPGELLDPVLASFGANGLATGGTVLELDADTTLTWNLSVDGSPEERLQGVVRGVWRRGEKILARVHVEADEASPFDAGAPRRLSAEVSLRPGVENGMEAKAVALLPSWRNLKETTLEELGIAIEVADIAGFLDGLWEPPPAAQLWVPSGSLAGSVRAQGPLLSPVMSAELLWTWGETVIAEATVHGPSLDPGSGLFLAADLLPLSPGQRQLDGRIDLQEAGLPLDLSAELHVPDLASAKDELVEIWPQIFPGQKSLLSLPEDGRWQSFVKGRMDASLSMDGEWREPLTQLSVAWSPDGEQHIELSGDAGLRWESPFFAPGAEGRLEVVGLDMATWQEDGEEQTIKAGVVVAGLLDLWVKGGLDEDGRLQGSAEARVRDLAVGKTSWLGEGRVRASLGPDRFFLEELAGSLAHPHPAFLGATFEGGGELATTPHLEGSLDVRLRTPEATIKCTNANLQVDSGVATLRSWADQRPGEAHLELPLGTVLDLVPFLGDRVDATDLPHGPFTLSLTAGSVDPWVSALLPDENAAELQGRLSGEVELDPFRPLEAKGELVLENLRLTTRDGAVVEADSSVRLVLSQEGLEVPEFRLVELETGTQLVSSARARYSKQWKKGDPLDTLIDELDVDVKGLLNAAVLNAVLAGGIASGPIHVDIDGRLEGGEVVADMDLEAPEGSIFFPIKYLTRIESPSIHLKLRGDELTLEDSHLVLNRGQVSLSGNASRGGRAQLTARFDDVRYRLDYGLNVIADGEIAAGYQPGRAPTLAGRVLVERGTLRRDIFLDLELLRSLRFGDRGLAEEKITDPVRLDIWVKTREGVKINNNLAELRLDWGGLVVSGTLGQPLIAGRIDADPGGWLEALGQLLRVDDLSIEIFDDPSIEPEIEIQTTSILDDPTLYQQRREGIWYAGLNADSPQNDLFWRESQHSSEAAMAQFSAGLASYFGDRLARFVGAGSMMRFSVQPLPLYGETSTEGRLTLTQQLGQYASFIASSDTRQAEAQSYILELSNILPRTKFQVFTTDDKDEGGTVQITTPLGRRQVRDEEHPRLAGVDWELPDKMKSRRLRRGLSFRKGDEFPPGSEFDVEIDVVEALHARGHPGSTVTVTPQPVVDGRLRLTVAVDPGPRMQAEFQGLSIPHGYRGLIMAGYLPSEIDRGASLQEVKREAERTLRRLSYFRPQATVEEVPLPGVAFEKERVVRIFCEAERQVGLQGVRVEGLPEDDAASFAAELESPLARLELAEGLPGADRRLQRLAKSLGYPDLKILDRDIDDAGQELVVVVDKGHRQTVASYEVLGMPDEHSDLSAAVSVPEGTPARRKDLMAQGRAMVNGLRDRGYPTADLDLEIEPRPEEPQLVDVGYVITAGRRLEVADVSFSGHHHTSDELLDELVTLEPGQPFRREVVSESRSNLFRTTLFESIHADLVPAAEDWGDLEDGEITLEDLPEEGGRIDARIELFEGPRYLMSYGGRWETTKGASAIVDVIDRNVRGLGQTLGGRVVYGETQRRLRLYYGLPRTPSPTSTLEFFAEYSDEESDLTCKAIRDAGYVVPECEDYLGDDVFPSVGESAGDVKLDVQEVTLRGQLTFPLATTTQARAYLVATNRRGSVRSGGDATVQNEGSEPGLQLGEVISPVLGIQLAHDTRRQTLSGVVSEGLFLGFQLSGSHESVGSAISVLEPVAEAKYYLHVGSLADKPILWAQRVRFGVQFTGDSRRVPLVDQYTAGGEYSLRGYPTESFGPGQVQLLINQELHFPVWGLISGLVFFDAGNIWPTWDSAFRDTEDCEPNCGTRLFSSVGLGLRFSAFRLDYAIPLNQRPGDPDYQVFFGFGNAF